LPKSALLRRFAQGQRVQPGALHRREVGNGVSVWLQAHRKRALLRRNAQDAV